MDMAERQIWDRVLARPGQEDASPLGQLANCCRESLEVYRSLLPRTGGRQRQLLRQLVAGEEENLACLRGLGHLRGLGLRTGVQTRREFGPDALRRCWDRSQLLLGEYTARSAMGGSGAVFRQMALRQERSCALLAALLGRCGR